MSDYDKRQYQMMLNYLDAFETNGIHLDELISNLEALLGALQPVDTEWKTEFEHHWAILEEVHADALDRKFAKLPDSHKKLLGDAVNALKSIVKSALHE